MSIGRPLPFMRHAHASTLTGPPGRKARCPQCKAEVDVPRTAPPISPDWLASPPPVPQSAAGKPADESPDLAEPSPNWTPM